MDNKTFYELERETAQQRINDEIGLLKIYDEQGNLSHTEETAEYKRFAQVLKNQDTIGQPTLSRKQSHEPLYFRVKKAKVSPADRGDRQAQEPAQQPTGEEDLSDLRKQEDAMGFYGQDRKEAYRN